MRILHLYKDYYPVVGGMENHVKVLAERQAAAGNDVSVLTFAAGFGSQRGVESGVTLIRASRWLTAASLPLGPTYPFLFWRQRPEIVHVHVPFPMGVVSNLLFGRSLATVLTYQSDIVKQKRLLKLYGPILRRGLRRADRIIVSSEAYLNSSPWLRPNANRCTVVPLGVDTDRFSPAASLADPKLVLFVGKFRHYKGLDTLLDAAERLPDFSFTLAGDGAMLGTIRESVVRRGLENRVRLPGFIPDEELPELYRAHGQFVLPAGSRAEAFGTVLLEAMASGLPVISTDVGSGTSWVVSHAETGLIVPPHDGAGLSEAIAAIGTSRTLAAGLGANGRKRVQEQFSEAAMVSGVMDVYRQALADRV